MFNAIVEAMYVPLSANEGASANTHEQCCSSIFKNFSDKELKSSKCFN